ncbi:MAG: VWA domain-containing protein, partial [Lachnospiraceae bacterium]|nr:VWA domain-containing protein [Lachnospiraceae bacterium]
GDYNGPLQYKFKGDDDLWVLLDGNVVIDLGGIHQAVESGTTETNHYVDLWQFLGGRENYDPTAQHTLTVLYLERGGYDSNCNMEFTIPHAGIISYSVPTGDLDFTKVNEDGEPLAGATFELKGKNGTSVTATSDENGIVHFGGLYVGNYTMTETDAPDDYEASTETWNVSVVATGETTAVATLKNASDESITEIVNKKLLPPPEITFDNEKTVAVNSYKDRTYTITLQANSTTQTSTNVTTGGPVDVMLLLDVSGSMNEKMDSYNRAGTYRSLKRTYYTSVLFVSLEHKNAIYDYENYFVEVGGSYYQIQEKIDSNFWGTENNYSYYYNGPSGKRTAVDDTTVLYSKMRLSALHASASQFLASLASKAPESKVGIVTFSSKDDNGYGGYSTLRGLETIGADASNAILSLDGMVPYGGTSPELAMQEAQRQFATVSNDGRKKIAILFTDGNPTGNRDFKYLSNEDINKIEYWDSKDDSENAAYELKQSGVSIYTVGFALGENAKDWLSGTIATSSSYALTAETQDELIKAFETVSSTITNNTSISNATVVDVLDPRFELVDDEEERLRSELEDGEALTVSEDGATITWTGVTLPYDGHWTRTIKIRAKADFIGGNAIPTNVNPGSKITAAGKEKEFPQPTVNVKLLDLEGTPSYVEVFLGDTIESKTFLGKLKGSFKISVNDETKKALTEGDYVDSYSGEVLGTVSFETMKKDGVAITSDQDVKNHPADHVGTPAEKYSLVAVYTPLTVAERVAKGYATPAPDAGTEVTVKRSKNESTHEVNVIAGTLTITKKISKLDYKKAYGDPVFTFKITDAKNASKVYYRTVHFTGDEKGLLFTKVSAKIDNLPKGTYVVEELDTMGFKPEGKPSYDGTALNTKRIANDSKVEFTLGKYDGKTYDKEAVTFTNKLKHSSRDTDTDVKKNTIKINEPTSSTDEVDNIKESMVDEEPQE